MKCKCLGRYATWVCRAVLAGSLLMAPVVTENFVAASNASTSATTTDEADAIVKEAKAIVAQPGTFYTLYVGMPHSDFRANFSNLPGWKARHYDTIVANKNITGWEYMRTFYEKDKAVRQEVKIEQLRNGPVYQYSNTFITADKTTAAMIYREMYTVLKNRYPMLEKSIPYRITTNLHYTPFLQVSSSVDLQLLFYKSINAEKGSREYVVYYAFYGGQAYNLY